MFIFAALGNLTYTLSIFTDPSAKTDQQYLHGQIPYVIGSVGTLAFDVTIFLQWFIWRNRNRYHRRSTFLSDLSGISSSGSINNARHKMSYRRLAIGGNDDFIIYRDNINLRNSRVFNVSDDGSLA